MSQQTDANQLPPSGSARELMARLLPLTPGRRRLEQVPTTPSGSVTPTGGSRAQKRKPLPGDDDDDDDDDDDEMMGKDVPTIFKRPRNKHDNPFTDGSAQQEVSFASAYPRFFMLENVPGGFPALAQTFSLGNLPFFPSGFIQAAGSSSDGGQDEARSPAGAGPSASARLTDIGESSSSAKQAVNPSRARRRRTPSTLETPNDSTEESDRVVDDETGMNLALAALRAGKAGKRRNLKRVRVTTPPGSPPQSSAPLPPPSSLQQQPSLAESSQPPLPAAASSSPGTVPGGLPADSDGAEAAMDTDENTSADKGKGRADSAAGGPGGNSGSFVTRAELGDIQYSLRQLNNNVGRLVVLMSEQTQYFSTMQARGWQQSRSAAQPQGANVDTDASHVDPATVEKLRRRAAHDPKPTELPTSRDTARNELAASIRAVTRLLMGRENSKSPFYPEHLADHTEAEDYDPAQGPACGLDDFRPDLAGTHTNAWNQCIVQVFVRHFMSLLPHADETEVTDLFQGHLKYLCGRYKESLQGAQAARRRQRIANRAERQRNLWVRRLTVAALHPDLQIHIPVLRSLGPFGMSSDESDHESGRGIQYRILKKPWRHPDLALWLRLFDRLYTIWRIGRMTGAQPHPRVASNAVSTRRPPVRGLPWNAYNQAWFTKLTDYDKVLLAPKMDETYTFEHPTSLRTEAGAL